MTTASVPFSDHRCEGAAEFFSAANDDRLNPHSEVPRGGLNLLDEGPSDRVRSVCQSRELVRSGEEFF
jgi:hypothetical protein